jgi:O-antigen ligase
LFFGGGGNFSYELVGKAIGLATESPHNNYLEILYDYGIFGLVSFIILLIHWFRSNKKNILAVSLILILIVSCLTLSPLMYAPFWFLMILIENQNLN